ncbi:MAG: amidohydrolase [Clostridiales bacterium]|nr:amidohydrolase [Clostridiales bacterium]
MRKKYKPILCWVIVIVFLLGLSPISFAETKEADSVYFNGNIYTVDEDFSIAKAIAIKDGKFVYVGDNEKAVEYIGKNTEVIDLKGATVLPGLIDSHLHYPGVGALMQQIDAFWLPKDDILGLVAEAAKRAQPGEWIIGRGWNQAVWDPAIFPSKKDLDAVAPNNPVVLTRVCGHATWANSLAMEIGGIDADGVTPNPVGGEIIRKTEQDEAQGYYPGIKVGEAIGVFTDTASGLITQHRPSPTENQLVDQLRLAQDHLLSLGITSVRDAGSDMDTFKRLRNLYEDGELKIRIYMMASSDSAEGFYKMPESERTGLFGDRLNVRSIKLMADGSLGARSAWMLESYADREGHIGDPRYTDEEFYNYVKAAAQAGFQVNTHAIGDAANRQVLDGYEKVIKEFGLKDHRYAIEHSQIVALEDIPRFAELGVLPSMQFVHATSDLNMAEDRVGPDRIKGGYAWRKFIDSGSIIPNGTDAAVELANPFHGLYAGVTRMTRDGFPKGGWYTEECLTKEEVLRAYTIWGAYAQFEEDSIGSIEPGKYADFVVIDRDYMTCPVNELKDIQALKTIIAGEVVYERDSTVPTIIWRGLPVVFATDPVNIEGYIYVPAQRMIEAIGAEGFTYDVDKDPVVKIKGEDYIKVRYLCESLGYSVSWSRGSNSVSIAEW